MSSVRDTLRVGEWLRLNYRLIGRGWSPPGFWASVVWLGIAVFLLGFMLPLFQHQNPQNAGNAATCTFATLLYGYALLLYPALRRSRRTDWHRNVLVCSPRMPGHALTFLHWSPVCWRFPSSICWDRPLDSWRSSRRCRRWLRWG